MVLGNKLSSEITNTEKQIFKLADLEVQKAEKQIVWRVRLAGEAYIECETTSGRQGNLFVLSLQLDSLVYMCLVCLFPWFTNFMRCQYQSQIRALDKGQ